MRKRKKLRNMHLPLSPAMYVVMKCTKMFLRVVCLFTGYQLLGSYSNVFFRKKNAPMWLVTGQPNQDAFEFKINMMWHRDKADKKLRTTFLLTCRDNLELYMECHPELFVVGE